MRRIALLLVLLPSLVQCSGDSSGPSQPTVPEIGGVWSWNQTLDDAAKGVSCSDQGTIDIDQAGSTFSAAITFTGVCTVPGGSVPRSGTTNTSGGQVSGQDISFRVEPLCQYEGTLSGTPSTAMNGTISCIPAFFQQIGDTISLGGTWQATR